MVVLLAPQRPGQRLTHDIAGVFVRRRRNDGGIELVGFGLALGENAVKLGCQHLKWGQSPVVLLQAQLDGNLVAGGNSAFVDNGRFVPHISGLTESISPSTR